MAKKVKVASSDTLTRLNRISPVSNILFNTLFTILALMCFLPIIFIAIISLTDNPVIRIADDGTPIVYGSPWSGKGAVYRNESCPIAGYLRLSQAPENRISRLARIASFGALLPSTLPTLQKEERTLDQICSTLSEMIVAVPTYALACLPDAAAAELSYTTIFGLKSNE